MAADDDHLPVISDNTSNAIVRYTSTAKVLHCPASENGSSRSKRIGPSRNGSTAT
jgi:hypothetical protein